MVVNNTDGCNYEESLILKLESASREFFTLTSDDDEEAKRLLIENTDSLNKALTEYRKMKTDFANSALITDATKRELRSTYIPKSLYEKFDLASIKTVNDLTRFVEENIAFLNNVFPSKISVLETVSSLDPISFRTFETEYPSIAIRLKSGQISTAEVSDLIKQNGLDSKVFAEQTRKNNKNVFDLLNNFLSKLGIGLEIMGSFCALVEDVFALAKGQRDLTGNSAQFLGNFSNVLGLINPKAAEIVGDVQELISLMQSAQQASASVGTDLQGAFSKLAGAIGIAMKFADILQSAQGNTSQDTGIEVDWNLQAISDAIRAGNIKFVATEVEITGNPLGDINQDGLVNTDDADAFDTYIANTAIEEVKSYIDDTLFPYMNKNAPTFSEFSNIPTASQPGSSMPNVLGSLSSVAGSIGAGPGAGDFGLSKIIQTISIASGIISSIQSLASGTKPVNIQGLFGQLDQIIQLGQQASEGMFTDFNDTTREYTRTVGNLVAEAERLAVDDKPKAAEISASNQESLETNVTTALETSAENSKNLGPRLVETVNKVRNGIRQLAAVGVLENLDQQLAGVVDQSATQLKSRISMFSPTSISNGFNANMLSSFGKMAGQIGQASAAASDATTAAMKNSVTGMIAQSSEKFRQKNKEEVEFVALRFCKLAGEIESMYRGVTSPLEQITGNFATADRSLSSVGSPITIRAMQAGALRLDTQARIAAMQQAGTIPANQTSFYTTPGGVFTNVPPQGSYPIDVVPPLPGDYEFPTYEEALRGVGGVLYGPGPSSRISGRAGFIAKSAGGGVDTDALRRLYLLAQRWGQVIRINSAYRSPAANDAANGKSGSYHLSGKAFDCSISGRSNQIRFMNLAYQIGFRGFGAYDTFTHIDTRGSPSDWGNFEYYNLNGPPGTKVG